MYTFPRVTFHPWVGAHYGRESRFGVSLLLLGESHYDEDQDCSDSGLTQEVVRTWGQQRRARFFTVIAKVLRGSEGWIDDDARSEIWEHVAFYNFVQSVVPGPRMPPTFRQWCEAQTPFKSVVQSLEPDAVLILGWRLAEHILHQPENVSFRTIAHPSSNRVRYEEAIPAFKGYADLSRILGKEKEPPAEPCGLGRAQRPPHELHSGRR